MNQIGGIFRSGLFCAALLFLVVPGSLLAADPPGAVPKTLLIRNVTLGDLTGNGEDRIVSILVRDKKLDIITEEEIALDGADLALDAKQGIVLGKLAIGEPANFMIIESDPREEMQVLLDTATYASFGIVDGEILRNRLPRTIDAGIKPKRSGWLAYTPPPMALPTTYQDRSAWNRWDAKYSSGIFLAALMLDRQNWGSQDNNSKLQVGDLSTYDAGVIRALRFGAVGTINFPQPWVYTVFAATQAFDRGFDTNTGNSLRFYDLRLDIPTFAGTTLSIGKQKEPITMERTMSLIYLPMQERSGAVDAMLPARNTGIVLSGAAFDTRMAWAGGVFNNWLETSTSFSEGATQYIGRVTGLPLMSADESNLLHLGIGMRYSDAAEGLHYLTEPEFYESPIFVDTGLFDANSSLTYNLEASWRRGPLWLLGEYTINDIDAPALGNPDLNGYYVMASWALTGEMRGYNRRSGIFNPLPVARSVYVGGWGAWEVAARWSSTDLTDGGIDGGTMEIASVGLNWWLSTFMAVNINHRWISLDNAGVTGDSRGIDLRIMLALE